MASKRVVDIVFLVDATGSMRDCIDGLKVGLKNFFAYLTDEERNKLSIRNWRAKIVGYRDVDFDDEWIVNNPFVTTVEDVNSQIDPIVADGGGDEPESLIDALLTVANMEEADRASEPDGYQWRNYRDAARAIVVFTDATYHPRAQREDYNGATYEDVARKMAEKRIILEVVTPAEPFDKSVAREDFEDCYKKLAMADKAEYLPLRTAQGLPMDFQDIPSNINLFRNFMEQLAKTVSASVAEVL